MDTNHDMSETKNDVQAAEAMARRTADEIFMRCAPALLKEPVRTAAAEVVARDTAPLLELLGMLADGLEGHSQINTHTGMLATFVEPEFFGKFRRVMLEWTNRRVLEGVAVGPAMGAGEALQVTGLDLAQGESETVHGGVGGKEVAE